MMLRPMLATPASELPRGPDWTYEVKWDGYRALAIKDGARLQLLSRNQKDLTRDYPTIVGGLRRVPATFVLDGEIVALDAEGRPSFQALQHRRTSVAAIVYYAFVLLEVIGESVVAKPLEERRGLLKALLSGGAHSVVLLSEPLPGTPEHIEREIRKLRLEGVVAKRRDSTYRSGDRTDAWVKVKFSPRQDFVIGGYYPNASNVDSILVGYYEQRKLYFAARVKAGFTPHTRAEVFRRISGLEIRTCPFVNLPNSTSTSHWGEGITAEDMKKFTWVKPKVVFKVAFVEWTEGGVLRHPQFVGVRDDMRPSDVRREREQSA